MGRRRSGFWSFDLNSPGDRMYLAGYDPAILPAGFAPCGTGACASLILLLLFQNLMRFVTAGYLPWAGGAKPGT